jgi:dolichol-phosphate mannosyltransferase
LRNESENIHQFTHRVLQVFEGVHYDLELILIDDGSTDLTWEKMLALQFEFSTRITLLRLEKNFGLEGAIKAGLSKATGDAVIVMDADLQDPPEVILKMIHEWKLGAHIVHAVRKTRKSDSNFKQLTAYLYYKLQSRVFKLASNLENAGNFKLIDRVALDDYLQSSLSKGVFRTSVPFLNFYSSKIYYDRENRNAGVSNYSTKSLIRFAIEILTSGSTVPLKLLFRAQLFVFASGLILTLLLHRFSVLQINPIFFALCFAYAFFNLCFNRGLILYVDNLFSYLDYKRHFAISEYLPASKKVRDSE